MNDWKAATTKETFQHICGLQLLWRLAGKQCLTAASDHVPWGQMFPLSRVNAVRITGHKGKHGAVRVCPRGFPHEPLNEPHTVSPLAPYISLPCWGWVALPIPPLMFRKTRSTICDRRWNRPERAGPQLTVIYKIVLILPTVFFFFFFFFTALSLHLHPRRCGWSCTSYGIKMSSASVLSYAEDGRHETGWPPRGHYRGPGQCLCAAVGEKNGPDAHAWNLQKTTFTIKHVCNNNALHGGQTCKAGEIWRQGEVSNIRMPFRRYCSSGDFWMRLVCCFLWCRLSSGCGRCEHRFVERWKLGNDKNRFGPLM